MKVLEIIFLVLCVIVAGIIVIGGLVLLLYAVIDRIILREVGLTHDDVVEDIPIKEEVGERIVYEAPIYLD